MYKVAVLKGDGIGPEIMDSALKVIDVIRDIYQIEIETVEGLIGGSAYDIFETPFPIETQHMIDQCDAVLLGAVGGPKWDNVKSDLRPEKGLLSLRKHLKAYCNIRPIIDFEALRKMSPIKRELPMNLCFVRELTGGIYFGNRKTEEINGITSAYDMMQYSKTEIERIAEKAFELASTRNHKVTSVDKSNVLDSSKLWRKTVIEKSKNHKSELNHMYVDNAAMQLILNPHQFDVILTSNMFGDILSDEASALVGSIGVLPSISIGDGIALYEPIHGSAPDIAGEGIANPIGMIMSIAEMYRYSFKREEIYDQIFNCITATLNEGYGTPDLKLLKHVTTNEWTDQLIKHMKRKKD